MIEYHFILGSILVGLSILGLIGLLIHDKLANACQHCAHPIHRHSITAGHCLACECDQFIPKAYAS